MKRRHHKKHRSPFFWPLLLSFLFLFSGLWYTRIVLPVPDRVQKTDVIRTLKDKSNKKTLWPFTEKWESQNVIYTKVEDSKRDELIKKIKAHAPFDVFPVLTNLHPRLVHAGIGVYPLSVKLERGFLLDANEAVRITAQMQHSGYGELKGKAYVFPHASSSSCEIKISSPEKTLWSGDINAPEPLVWDSTSWFKKLKEKISPMSLPKVGNTLSFSVPLQTLPNQLSLQVVERGNQNPEKNCVTLVSDLSFEVESATPLKSRGTIFILADQLNFQTAHDASAMPSLQKFHHESSLHLTQHHAVSNLTVPSVSSLLTSRYPRELGHIAFTYAPDDFVKMDFLNKNISTLPQILMHEGYRVGAIGNIALFTEALQGGVDLGFHDAHVSESMHYETRNITESALQWLQDHGDAPFFLYLHYYTMHGPYRSPFSDLNFGKFIKHPFGLNSEIEHYKGIGRYLDRELAYFFEKLHQLGLQQNVDIIFTADHGAELNSKPYGMLDGVEINTQGASRDKGHGLTEDEMLVPFSWKFANLSNTKNCENSLSLTSHVDVLPSLMARMITTPNADTTLRGVNWLSQNQLDPCGSLQASLKDRTHILFDAHRYTGVMQSSSTHPQMATKYVKQLAPESFLLTSSYPWRKRVEWFQPEQAMSIQLANHEEKWLPDLASTLLRPLKKLYENGFSFLSRITLKSGFDGNFDFTFYSYESQKTLPLEKGAAENVKVSPYMQNGLHAFKVTGTWKVGDELNIVKPFILIDFKSPHTLLACPPLRKVAEKDVATLFRTAECLSQDVRMELIPLNFKKDSHPVVIQRKVGPQAEEKVSGNNANEALQGALRDWGYAK